MLVLPAFRMRRNNIPRKGEWFDVFVCAPSGFTKSWRRNRENTERRLIATFYLVFLKRYFASIILLRWVREECSQERRGKVDWIGSSRSRKGPGGEDSVVPFFFFGGGERAEEEGEKSWVEFFLVQELSAKKTRQGPLNAYCKI